MSDNFVFRSVDNVSDLSDVVSSKSYEVIIKPMDLGARNDLSILVHDDPMINNAQYKNQTLKTNLADLNQSSRSIKQKIIKSIQEIYRKDTPFMILGNTMEYIGVADHISRTPSTDASISNVRDQLLNQVRPVYSLHINSNLLYSPTHLLKFLIGSHVQ
jgi:xanthine dehydrogenase molybdopterin-binding subunit B